MWRGMFLINFFKKMVYMIINYYVFLFLDIQIERKGIFYDRVRNTEISYPKYWGKKEERDI